MSFLNLILHAICTYTCNSIFVNIWWPTYRLIAHRPDKQNLDKINQIMYIHVRRMQAGCPALRTVQRTYTFILSPQLPLYIDIPMRTLINWHTGANVCIHVFLHTVCYTYYLEERLGGIAPPLHSLPATNSIVPSLVHLWHSQHTGR